MDATTLIGISLALIFLGLSFRIPIYGRVVRYSSKDFSEERPELYSWSIDDEKPEPERRGLFWKQTRIEPRSILK